MAPGLDEPNPGNMEEDTMMPLTLASVGEENMIKKVGGKAKIKKHLEDLGFIAGGNVKMQV